ncbi:histone-lysine N-methyltransferase SUVR4-like isoform X1 [Triticum dicoccoides]|uniref:histone-lysine N-methyltransferase SUVR4-like isoform X1 n=1 Tax=Triticum dicoccoides TaxID=85692 RepID=UPI00188F4813|nr:histone-lysine N-methyltransferase SUVR4-like isoform X1 [Triticum dicoccoides]XP_037486473.1 histone-lysine N-methyltransferase SUVR4-like isoform X1 [Triticum dicoccoides]XP_037486474.1 histone-lysine N-methyltransferase SUVR4-like isoform X1 [Triticum dicoccoides]XP_037486475.1 histone-lysine N-methyltransferase SUVR4-like isoform X1 [Triticum dicoccoides]
MISHKDRAQKAYEAMGRLGFPKKQVSPVLKHLYKLFESWEPIEDESYRILADTILDSQKNQPMPGTSRHVTDQESEPHNSTSVTPDPDDQHPSAARYGMDVSDNETSLINRSMDVSENPQDALFLQEPKPEPEIDVPAAPVANDLNTGSSGGDNMLIEHCKTRDMLTWDSDARASIVNHDQNPDSSQHAVKDGVESTVQNTHEASFVELDVASSTLGEVKVSLKCKFDPSEVCISLDKVFKIVEDKCLRSYKTLPPDFSVGKLMNEICQYVAESRAVHSEAQNNGGSLQEQALETHAPFVKPIACKHAVGGNGNAAVGSSSEPSFQNWVVAYHPQEALFKQRPLHDVADITKGQERVRIPIVNEFGSDSCPPLFYYIRKNLIFQSAYVNTSLARIGDEDCCADCSGNCLLEPHPCPCARSTGGEIAYTPEGLVRAELIDECIAVNHFPEKDNKFYCKACPLQIYKTKPSPDPCKGHLARKFIKECWSKCGCGKQCGNRVIQRGITCNLQVFFTNEGKGWGLRTLDGLPKGAFICELVGEVLTSSELYERKAKNSKHVDQVLLDASWGSEGVLRDEEALCLDLTFYGNVGRFVNHRCYDANLVIIPVEVETPDRHYYHLALFTAKKIEAFEELTRDYGIDFDGTDDLNKAFDCMCGSKYCRGGPKNSRKRTRASASRN